MANNTSGVFETLIVPAATNGKLLPRYKNRALDLCFNGYRSEYGTVGKTMQINLPVVDESKVTNIGSGSISLSDTDQVPVSIVIDQKLSSTRRIQSFDQIRTPLDFQQQYLLPMIEEVLRKSNRAVAGLFLPANFDAYPTITGPTGKAAFSRANIAAAWSNVAGTGGAPVNPQDTFLLTDQVAYGNMVGDDSLNFIQQFVVGDRSAASAQQDAKLMPMFNAQIDWDQTVPTDTVGKHGGLFFHRMAVGLLPVLEPKPEDTYIRQVVLFPTAEKNFPINVQFWHSPDAQGHIIHVFATFGVKVVKPEWGSYLETN